MSTGQGRETGLARAAVTAVFLINGIGYGNWVARIPSIRDGLRLDTQALGLALLGVAVGSLIGLPISGALVASFGSRRMTTIAGLAFTASLVLPALATNAVTLALGLVVLGAATGILDVSMNAAGAIVERRGRRSIMSSYHAGFSFGGLLGAALGGFLAGRGIAPLPHLTVTALVGVGAMALVTRPLLPSDASERVAGPAFAKPTRSLAILGAIGFAALLSEGAMADWSGIYLRDARATDTATAAYGYAAFSLCMAIGRLGGDWLVGRFGTANAVRAGGIVAALGLSAVLVVPSVGLVLLSAAGRSREVSSGTALAAVSTLGYLGFLAGPPILGVVAHSATITVALWLVVVLCVGIAALAGAVDDGAGHAGRETLAPSN